MSGYLKIILGPMFSGKTTELIRIFHRYNACNIPVCAVNYKEDTRYHEYLMSTHNKDTIPSINLYKLSELKNAYTQNKYDVFLINEGQFFEDLYDTVDELVNTYNKKVYVCGLDGDYKRKKFGSLLDIIPLADDVVKIKGICQSCKKNDAIFTHRISDEKTQKLVGSDNYTPLCRGCYNLKN